MFSFASGVLVRRITIITLLCWSLLISSQLKAEDLLALYVQAQTHDYPYLMAVSQYQGDLMVKDLGLSRYKPSLSYRYRIAENRYKSDQQSLMVTEGFDPSQCSGTAQEIAECVAAGLSYEGRDSDYQSQEHVVLLSQPIYDSARVADKQKSDVLAVQAHVQLKLAEQELIMRLLERYLHVLKARDDVTLAQQQLQSTEDEKTQAQRRFRLGVARETEVFDAQAAFDSQITAYDLAQAQLQIALRLLSDMVGFAVRIDYGLSEFMPVVMPEPLALDAWLALAQAHSEQLKMVQLSEQVAYKEYQKKQRARWPKVMALASYSESDLKQGQGFTPAASNSALGLELSVPIYNGGSMGAEKKQAAYRLQEAKQRRLNQLQWMNTEVSNTYLLMATDIKRFQARSRSLKSAQRALDATRDAYYDGVSSLLDLLQVQRHFYRTKRDLAASRYDYLLHLFKLRQVSGTLSLQHLQQLNQWLLPSSDSAALSE